MKTRFFIQAVIVAAAASIVFPVLADTMSIPGEDHPAFTFDVPSTWNPKLDKDDESAEATAPDKHVYLVSWLVTKEDMKTLTGDIASTLKDSMSSVDPNTQQEKLQMNGVDFTIVKGSGIDKQEGGKVRFQVALFPTGAGKVGIFYADYDADAPADTMDVLQGIMKSIKIK